MRKTTESPLRLWYDRPAAYWEEALPIGNGRLGSMVFSGPVDDRLTLNEDTLWSGYPRRKGKPDAADHFPQMQQLVREGRIKEAQTLFEQTMSGGFTESYLPLGDILLRHTGIDAGQVTGYRRELRLEDAVVRTTFRADGITYTRTAFVSAPAQCLVVALEADRPGSVALTASLASRLRHTVTARENRLELEGLAPSHVEPNYVQTDNGVTYAQEDAAKGMRFLGILAVEATGGTVTAADDALTVEGADRVLLRFCARTSFNGFDRHPYLDGAPYRERCLADLALSQGRALPALLEEHRQDYQSLFDRVGLRLSGGGRGDLPTDRRLLALEETGFDADLFSLIFQYGRYLMISSSRPGTQAANLQGIWNSDLRPAWSSNFTVNINTQMNYWPAEICGLSECHEPLFRLIEAIAATGGETARDTYRAGGFTAHHNVDIWALSTPVGEGGAGTSLYAFWPMSAGWLCRHLYEHYEYTRDRAFLEETAYPLLLGAAEFYLDLLEEDGDGHYLLTPSTSPENAYLLDGERLFLARTTTMTMSIVRETLENLVAAEKEMNLRSDRARRAEAILPKLYPLKIGGKGQLLEWDREYEEAEPHHRHNSHLYALHPAHHITPESTPALADACRTTLRLRGDDGTGWCLGWRVCLWARLEDGDHALTLLRRQLRLVRGGGEVSYMGGGGTYANLLDAHPPFQIDGNFGATAGMAELFVQSRGRRVKLLPALPAAFGEGQVRGLRAHGGLVVDMAFADNRLTEARLTAQRDMEADYAITWGGKTRAIRLGAGQSLRLTPADFS